jgi:hypothetical protein
LTFPGSSARACFQSTKSRILLAAGHLDPFAGAQFIQRLAGQLAVTLKLAHGKADVLIVRLVGQAVPISSPMSFCIGKTYSVARGS